MSSTFNKIQKINEVKQKIQSTIENANVFGISKNDAMFHEYGTIVSNLIEYFKNGKELLNDGTYINDQLEILSSNDEVHNMLTSDESIITFKNSSALSIGTGFLNDVLSAFRNIECLCCQYVYPSACVNSHVLSSAYFPSCKRVGGYAFKGSANTKTQVPGGEKGGWYKYDFPECISVDTYAFQANQWTSYNMPKLTTVGSYAFANNDYIYGFNAPEVTSLGDYAFYYSGNNQTKNMSADFSKVVKLGARPFRNAYLSTLSLPALSNVGGGTFQDMLYLVYINIPMVSNFINGIFSNVPKLSVIDMHDKSDDRIPDLYAVSTITSLTSNPTIVVPDRLYDAWIAAPKWSECETIRPGTIVSYTTYTSNN